MNNTNTINTVNNLDIPYLELGGGFVLGLFLGFFFKTFKKNLQSIMMGFMIIAILLIALDYIGYIKINEIRLENALGQFGGRLEHFWLLVKNKFEHYQFEGGISVLAGFLAGMNMVKPAKK